jgi:signal transduction histidine kinase
MSRTVFSNSETIGLSKSGRRLNVSLTVSPVRDPTGRLVGVAHIARDITDRKTAEEALAGLNRRLVDAQEQERARIARELHDDIGQRLALLTVQLGSFGNTTQSPDVQNSLIELERQASMIAADVQALSHELHSAKLDVLGIEAAMSHFCEEFADQHKMNVEVQIDSVRRDVPSHVALSLLRVLQEALRNSVKHSGVRQAEVRLWESDNWLHLVVRDRGAGFNVEQSKHGHGLGLFTMAERMSLVNGILSVTARPQRGATVHARAPL